MSGLGKIQKLYGDFLRKSVRYVEETNEIDIK